MKPWHFDGQNPVPNSMPKTFQENCDAWNACHMNKWKVNAYYTYVFRAPVLLQSHLLRVLPRWAHHETLRNGGHVLRELQGASNASSLQPRNVDQHVQKLSFISAVPLAGGRLEAVSCSQNVVGNESRFSGFHRILIVLSQTTWWNTS